MVRFIGLFDTVCDYNLQFTVVRTHALVPTVMSSLLLLGSGFPRRMFPFLSVPEQQQLTTEPQQSSK
jgi:hypothetical protein